MHNDYSIIKNITNKIETPFYLFDEKELLERTKRIKSILGNNKLCFSIKSNPFLAPYLSNYVDRIEVCSPGEMKICIRYGIVPEKIIYSGVVRKRDELEEAMSYGVRKFTVESAHQYKLLEECCEKPIEVYLRLNSGAQFGMSLDDADTVFLRSKKNDNISLRGIHYFAGTQRRNKGFNKQKQELDFLKTYIEKKNAEGLKIDKLEYGPGLPASLFEGDEDENDCEYISTIKNYLNCFDGTIDITVEMGRYISTYCGVYVTQILDIKSIGEANYCLTDGGINHLTYTGQVMGMKTPKIHHFRIEEKEGSLKDYFICGSLCTTGDVLTRLAHLCNPQIGDLLVFDNVGAYSVSEGISLFLSRKLPAVLMRKCNEDIMVLREAFDTSILNTGKEE